MKIRVVRLFLAVAPESLVTLERSVGSTSTRKSSGSHVIKGHLNMFSLLLPRNAAVKQNSNRTRRHLRIAFESSEFRASRENPIHRLALNYSPASIISRSEPCEIALRSTFSFNLGVCTACSADARNAGARGPANAAGRGGESKGLRAESSTATESGEGN